MIGYRSLQHYGELETISPDTGEHCIFWAYYPCVIITGKRDRVRDNRIDLSLRMD